MGSVSLNTAYASSALFALRESQGRVAMSIARLSSGNRIVQAKDDVAGMAIASGLRTNVATLRQAVTNTLQASTMLGIADSSLGQLGEMLQRMQALTVQAASGALTDTDRGFLDEEFQNLRQQIDQVSSSANFNGISVLQAAKVPLSAEEAFGPSVAATAASAALSFNANPTAGQTLVLNGGATITFGVDVAVGVSYQQTVTSLAAYLNASTDPRLNIASYTGKNGVLGITMLRAGAIGNDYAINYQGSTVHTKFDMMGVSRLSENLRYNLTGGSDGSLPAGSVSVSGNSALPLLTNQNQSDSVMWFRRTIGTGMKDGDLIAIDAGDHNSATLNNYIEFTFRTNPTLPTDIKIGKTDEETMANAVGVMNNYLNTHPAITTTQAITQMNFRRDGTTIYIESKLQGAAYNMRNLPVTNTETGNGTLYMPNGSPLNTLDTGSLTGGVSTVGISNNAGFVGTIQGFTATYLSANTVNLGITVGGIAYTAANVGTQPAANQVVRFTSSGGGYFEIEMAGGAGMEVKTGEDAKAYASGLDAAFSTLRFSQTQHVALVPTDGMTHASFSLTTPQTDGFSFGPVHVTAATPDTAATITFQVNGVTYSQQARIGGMIGAHERFTFSAGDGSGQALTLEMGDTGYNLADAAQAKSLEDKLNAILPDDKETSLRFQVGTDATQAIGFTIDSVSSEILFGKESLDIQTAADASGAERVVATAINQITARRATVGALDARFDYARSVAQSSLANEDSARATLADTDVASESTAMAAAMVGLQASIGVLAQGNRLSSSLVEKLLE